MRRIRPAEERRCVPADHEDVLDCDWSPDGNPGDGLHDVFGGVFGELAVDPGRHLRNAQRHLSSGCDIVAERRGDFRRHRVPAAKGDGPVAREPIRRDAVVDVDDVELAMRGAAEPAVGKGPERVGGAREERLHHRLPRELRCAAAPVGVGGGDVVLAEYGEYVVRHPDVAVEVADEKRRVDDWRALGPGVFLRPAVEAAHRPAVRRRDLAVVSLLRRLEVRHQAVRRSVVLRLRSLRAGLQHHHRRAHEPHLLQADFEGVLLLGNAVGQARPARLPLVREPRAPLRASVPPRRAAGLCRGVGEVAAPDGVHLAADLVYAALELVAGERGTAGREQAGLALVRRAGKLGLPRSREHGADEPVVRLPQVAALRPFRGIAPLVLVEEPGVLAYVVAEVEVAPCVLQRLALPSVLVAVDRHHPYAVRLRLFEELGRHELRLSRNQVLAARPLHKEVALPVRDHLGELGAFSVSRHPDENFSSQYRRQHFSAPPLPRTSWP